MSHPTDEPTAPEMDLTGRSRLAWNVFAGWAGYLVMAATGFLTPRAMDHQLGQEALGVWDFGWSLVSYLRLTQLGVGSAINRYVSRHRAVGDMEGLRRVASSVTCINAMAAAVAIAIAGVGALLLPHLIELQAAGRVGQARVLVLLLGATIASGMGFQVYHGVLSGCHRFDIQNAITAGFDVATSLAMIAALYAGGGLITLGFICLGFGLATEATRFLWAHRVCPELRVHLAFVNRAEMLELLRFGMKSFLLVIAELLFVQANKLAVGGALGLGALAVFSRPLALVNIMDSFAWKLAYVLAPAASSLQSSGRTVELQGIFLQSIRLGAALALPLCLGLAVLGDPLLVVWMGPRYSSGLVVVVLALGMAVPMALRPVTSILLGLDRHGRLAVATLVAASAAALLGVVNARVLGWGLVGAAMAITLPRTVSAAYVAVHAWRGIGVSLRDVLRTLVGPVACGVPFTLVLVACRLALPGRPATAVMVGAIGGCAVLLPLYWRFVVPVELQGQIRRLPAHIRSLASS
jgi:O-antigen/teichoic acid export membrane protein